MLTPTSWSAAALILVALLFGACSDNDQGNISSDVRDTLQLTRIHDQLVLDLCSSVVEVQEAESVYAQVYQTFFYDNDQTPVSTLFETIDLAHILALGEAAEQAHPDHECDGYVTGLKISLGLSGTNVKLLYQLAYFCRDDADNFNASAVGTHSVYNASGFSQAGASELAWMEAYMQHLKIMQNGVLRDFDSERDSTDTRAVYVTFQALEAVMRHNNREAITIYNYMATLPDNGAVRHSLIIAPEGLAPGFLKHAPKELLDSLWLFSNFENKFADRSNLCPPSCEIVSFKVETSGQPNCQ